MDKYRQIAELIQGFQRKGQVFFPATVERVDGNTCTINVEGFSISDVRLKATNDNTEDIVLLKPAEGSNVLIGSYSGDYSNLFIISSDSLSEAYFKVGEISFKMDLNGIQINDGKLGGITKIGELVKKLNALEKDLNSIKTNISTWIPTPQDGGASLKVKLSTWSAQKLIETKQADIEDKKITH